jgi:hypothetical protein
MSALQSALEAHNLSYGMSAKVVIISVLVSLLAGLTIIFFYAASRPRFGPGPRTAVIVAVVLWIGSYFLSLVGYYLLGLFPTGLLAIWGAVGLVEMVIAALAGGWIYREAQAGPGPTTG